MEMKCVANFRTRMEAELARNMLAGEDIPAYVNADDAGGWRPDLLLGAGGVRLVVREQDADRARELLAGVEEET
jgi:hypothetical protein